jgi:hypothetical protein
MKKIESLKQLIETIKVQPLVSGSYVDVIYVEGEHAPKCCHCVVGYLLKNGGMEVEKLESLDSLDETNPYQSYLIDKIMDKSHYVDNDFVGSKLVELGFSLDDSNNDKEKLRKLQVFNDSNQFPSEQIKKDTLIKFIEDWIEDIEKVD